MTKKAMTKSTGTNLALLDQQLAAESNAIKGMIGQSTGRRIALEATGDFVTPDGLNLGKEIQVVVVDFVSRNNYYSVPYDRDNPSPPDCYAVGRVIADMAPEADSPHKMHVNCATCSMNAFGSGANGKSKACQNRRLLGILLLDPDNANAHNEPDTSFYTLDVSPSNIRSFDGAVAHVARALQGPPVKAIFTVTGKNVGTYASMTFTDPLPNPDYAAHFSRRTELQELLNRKPDFAAAQAKAAAKPTRRTVGARR